MSFGPFGTDVLLGMRVNDIRNNHISRMSIIPGQPFYSPHESSCSIPLSPVGYPLNPGSSCLSISTLPSSPGSSMTGANESPFYFASPSISTIHGSSLLSSPQQQQQQQQQQAFPMSPYMAFPQQQYSDPTTTSTQIMGGGPPSVASQYVLHDLDSYMRQLSPTTAFTGGSPDSACHLMDSYEGKPEFLVPYMYAQSETNPSTFASSRSSLRSSLTASLFSPSFGNSALDPSSPGHTTAGGGGGNSGGGGGGYIGNSHGLTHSTESSSGENSFASQQKNFFSLSHRDGQTRFLFSSPLASSNDENDGFVSRLTFSGCGDSPDIARSLNTKIERSSSRACIEPSYNIPDHPHENICGPLTPSTVSTRQTSSSMDSVRDDDDNNNTTRKIMDDAHNSLLINGGFNSPYGIFCDSSQGSYPSPTSLAVTTINTTTCADDNHGNMERLSSAAMSAANSKAPRATVIKKARHQSGVVGVKWHQACNAWVATWRSQGRCCDKKFAVRKYGFEEARRLAILHRLKVLEEGVAVPCTSKSGVKGVFYDHQHKSWAAHWRLNGDKYRKWFSVKTYGFDLAREKAIRCRIYMERKHYVFNTST